MNLKNKLLVLVLVFSLFPNFSLAQTGTCSPVGYTIFTINGISTNIEGATANKDTLKTILTYESNQYKNEPLTVDFLYNPTHAFGVDLLDAKNEVYFDQQNFDVNDSDFGQMLTDASQKLNTQKVLLVGHSQGNFYANSIYDTVADQPGGVPYMSIGVYSVATPSTHVAGDGLYLTSSTDKIIAGVVANGLNAHILPPNIRINFQATDDDGLGHSFSGVYMKYAGDKIVADIKSSLDKLQSNDIQKEDEPCMAPPKLTITQKVQGVLLATLDGASVAINQTGYAVENAYMAFINGTGNMIAGLFGKLSGQNGAAVATSDDSTDNPQTSTDANPVNNKSNNDSSQKTNDAKTTTVQNNQLSQPVVNTEQTLPGPADSAPAILAEEDKPSTPDNAPGSYADLLQGGGGMSADTIVENFENNSTPPPPPAPPLPDPDITPPVITILGQNPLTVLVGTSYNDPGVTSTDAVDGSVAVDSSGAVNTSAVGSYIITYTAHDSSGNNVSATRTVNVVDTTSPVINLNGLNPVSIDVGSTYNDAGASAIDELDGNISVSSTGSVNTNIIGTYIITYTATDSHGNTATEYRTVRVEAAPTPPSNDYLDTPGNLVNGSVLFWSPAFDTPDNSHTFIWYHGNYPDTSNPFQFGNFLTNLYLSTLPCGHICLVSAPEYFWIGIYNDLSYTHLVHYTEVHYTGGFRDQPNHYDITAQGNLP